MLLKLVTRAVGYNEEIHMQQRSYQLITQHTQVIHHMTTHTLRNFREIPQNVTRVENIQQQIDLHDFSHEMKLFFYVETGNRTMTKPEY